MQANSYCTFGMGKGDKFFNSPFGLMDVKPPTGTPRRPWIRAYTAPNRLLVSENGWPFRRFGGGAGSGGGAPRPSRARLCAPTNASPSRPDPPTLIRRRLVDSDHRRPRQAALQRRKTAEKRLKETGKALLPREAAHRRQQGRSTRRSGPARPIPGRVGAVPLARPACDQPAPSQMRVGERGAGGLGADWAAGAVGSRAECAAGRPLRAGEGKRGRASGRRQAGAPPGERRLRPRAVLERVGAADVAGRLPGWGGGWGGGSGEGPGCGCGGRGGANRARRMPWGPRDTARTKKRPPACVRATRSLPHPELLDRSKHTVGPRGGLPT